MVDKISLYKYFFNYAINTLNAISTIFLFIFQIALIYAIIYNVNRFLQWTKKGTSPSRT